MQNLEKICIKNILAMAKAWCKASGSRLSTASRYAHGDSKTFDRLAKGKGSITVVKYDDVMNWFRVQENWPEGAVIPEVYEPWRTAP